MFVKVLKVIFTVLGYHLLKLLQKTEIVGAPVDISSRLTLATPPIDTLFSTFKTFHFTFVDATVQLPLAFRILSLILFL